MTERIEEIKNLIDKEFKNKVKMLNEISNLQSEVFEIDKIISKLNLEKEKTIQEIEDSKIQAFDDYVHFWEKGLNYIQNDLVFFDGKIYKVKNEHQAEEIPDKDLVNYIPINRKGVSADDSTTN